MAVAPSFKDFPKVSEPYEKNGKQYIKVKNEKTGTVREVRWYTDFEYSKLYEKGPKDILFLNLKKVRGFEYGPILVIRGNKEEDECCLRESCARYAVGIGWYITSEDLLVKQVNIHKIFPAHFKYLSLTWEEFKGDTENSMKNEDTLYDLLLDKERKGEWVN